MSRQTGEMQNAIGEIHTPFIFIFELKISSAFLLNCFFKVIAGIKPISTYHAPLYF